VVSKDVHYIAYAVFLR